MLEGLSLFHTSKGWQLSTKEENVDGWSVRFISNARASRIFDALESSRELEATNRKSLAKTETADRNGRAERVLIEE